MQQFDAMKRIRNFIAILYVLVSVLGCHAAPQTSVKVGAERVESYLPMLKGKRVALLSNHTGIVPDGRHTLDVLMDNGVDVRLIFSPEHGFRGTADAGEHVSGSVDRKTGVPIESLYGSASKRVPSAEAMSKVDVVVCDMQDVGLRFYTYYITMLDVMNAAAAAGKQFVVLDRPNPNGMYVDGPVLDMRLASGVGRLPIPVVHGMTLGELARMIVGEKWLNGGAGLDLMVVPCDGYTHAFRYSLPVAPSPNLPDMKAVYLYPSTCLFEGTVMSLGRGTEMPFCVYGHPDMKGCTFEFTPQSRPGAKNPPLRGRRCHGRDLRSIPDDTIIARGLDLEYVIDAMRHVELKGKDKKFFTSFFDKLIGNTSVRRMLEQGKSAADIKATWQSDVEEFRRLRRPYLLYPEG